MGPSITDVAKLAGVGKGTVSRVLNNRPGVSERTAARVRHAIRDLGYRPNVQARRLARNVSDLICFVLSNRDFLHEFHSMVFKGIESYCSEVGRDLVFALWRYPLDQEPSEITLPRIIAERGSVDGVVLAGANRVECVKAISSMGLPCIAFGNNLVGCKSLSEVDAVWYDESIGTREAVRYLADMGHRHMRFVANISIPWFARNCRAFRDALLDLRLTPTTSMVGDATDYIEVAERAIKEILTDSEPPTALFAGNDNIGIALVRGLVRNGIRVPQDISVIGFDDIPRCLDIDPNLTTIRVPKEDMGAECARFLFDRIANPGSTFGARVVPTQLIIRDSCAPPSDKRSIRE